MEGRAIELCEWPQIEHLARLDEQYPDSRFILTVRDPAKHEASIKRWGNLHQRLALAALPGLPAGVGNASHELRAWFAWHDQKVREYFDAGGVDDDAAEAAGAGVVGDAAAAAATTRPQRHQRERQREKLVVLDVEDADAPERLAAHLCRNGWLARLLDARGSSAPSASSAAAAAADCPTPWWGKANTNAAEYVHGGETYQAYCKGVSCV